MCFIDLTQAFDKVRLTDVIKLLEERKVHQNIVSIIRELNTGNHTLVKAENRTTKKIPVNTGIKQGGSLSPILFNIIMNEIIPKPKQNVRRYGMGNAEIKIMCYADNAVIVPEDKDNLQRLLYKFEQTTNKHKTKICTRKTQSLQTRRLQSKCRTGDDL